MSSTSRSILSLLTLCFCATLVLSVKAQDSSDSPQQQTASCVRWMKATVPGVFNIEPAQFCSGSETVQGSDAWWSVHSCGQRGENVKGPAPQYCASMGRVTPGDTLAIALTSATRDGADFLARTNEPPTSEASSNSHRSTAILYTRTPAWIGGVRVPAGLLKLSPSHSSEGWTVIISKQSGEWDDDEQPQILGTVPMKSISTGTAGHGVGFNISKMNQHCSGADGMGNVRELHILSGDLDLMVCVRPDQAPPTPGAEAILVDQPGSAR